MIISAPDLKRNFLRRLFLSFFVFAAFYTLWVPCVFGAETSSDNIDWLNLFMKLFGGLALFLNGLDMLSAGLKKAAGDSLRKLLAKMTTNRFLGAITGAVVTGVLNSSSVTTVLVVGFITAGVMNLTQSVGVIMGANIGSTVTAQLLAFNLSAYSLILVSVGFFMLFAARRESMKFYGMMIMGLGLVFFGMGLMSTAMNPLRTYEPFMDFLVKMEKPLFGILAGAVFTGLVQSSAATVGIAIAMATEGLLSLPAGIALALGANIGTCVTALLAAIGKPVEAVRAAVVHILFNIFGVLIWLPFFEFIGDIATMVTPVAADGSVSIARQLANANTMFNVVNTVVFIGFTSWFAKLAEKLVPNKKVNEEKAIIEPKYLDDGALQVPSVALQQVRHEFGRMGKITLCMLQALPGAIREKDTKQVDHIVGMDDHVDILERAIFKFLGSIRNQSLTNEESYSHQQLMSATIQLENLADIVENEISDLVRKYISKDRQVSDWTQNMFNELFEEVFHSVELTCQSIELEDQKIAHEVIKKSPRVREIMDSIFVHKAEGLGVENIEKLETDRIEIALVEKFGRIYDLAKRISITILPPEITDKI
ncbi:MAG: Na/Pi cotransporter family protein [Desulfotalea sp.]